MSKKVAKKADQGASAPSAADRKDSKTADVSPEPELTLEEKLVAQVEQWKDHAQRAQAEFENARKRLEQRAADQAKYAGARVVEAIIPALDDLDFAIAAANATTESASGSGTEAVSGESEKATPAPGGIFEGFAAIRTKLIAGLESEGVEVLDPTGLPLDPETTQAIGMIPTPGVPEQTVVLVLQKGYRLAGRILRPAMVMVASAPADEAKGPSSMVAGSATTVPDPVADVDTSVA